jgi:hypothetical protein
MLTMMLRLSFRASLFADMTGSDARPMKEEL